MSSTQGWVLDWLRRIERESICSITTTITTRRFLRHRPTNSVPSAPEPRRSATPRPTRNSACHIPAIRRMDWTASDDNGYSNYNSLQVTLRHQFSHGLSMQAAYTWDKDLTDVFCGPTAPTSTTHRAWRAQYGRASFDRPQRFVVNYSYDLPFGKGSDGDRGKLISGWNVSGVSIFQSGDPLNIIDDRLGFGLRPPFVPLRYRWMEPARAVSGDDGCKC